VVLSDEVGERTLHCDAARTALSSLVNAAMMASPMVFTTVPPFCSTAARRTSKLSRTSRNAGSSPARLYSAVEADS
jgi:hypothetical protein